MQLNSPLTIPVCLFSTLEHHYEQTGLNHLVIAMETTGSANHLNETLPSKLKWLPLYEKFRVLCDPQCSQIAALLIPLLSKKTTIRITPLKLHPSLQMDR